MKVGITNALTVDVEDWNNATVLQCTGRVLPPTPAVERNTRELFELLATCRVRATWFFLGEVAEAYPDLVRKVSGAGHELGVHGFHHHQIGALSREAFRDSIQRAKTIIEQAGGTPVAGYRAVDFGIDRHTWWALDTLLDLGFAYDASVFPIKALRYGMAGAPTTAHWALTESGRSIYEIPTTVARFCGIRVPFAGGGYFRLVPYWMSSFLFRREQRKRPVVFYLHPCEIEESSELAPLGGDLSSHETRLIQRRFAAESRGRARGRAKVRRLLASFRFSSITEVFHIAKLSPPPVARNGIPG